MYNDTFSSTLCAYANKLFAISNISNLQHLVTLPSHHPPLTSPSPHITLPSHHPSHTSPSLHITLPSHHLPVTSPSPHITLPTHHLPLTSPSLHITLPSSPSLHIILPTHHPPLTSPSLHIPLPSHPPPLTSPSPPIPPSLPLVLYQGNGYTQCMNLLMNYPGQMEVQEIVQLARHMRYPVSASWHRMSGHMTSHEWSHDTARVVT